MYEMFRTVCWLYLRADLEFINCGTARHVNSKYCNYSNPFVNLRVQLIEFISLRSILINIFTKYKLLLFT